MVGSDTHKHCHHRANNLLWSSSESRNVLGHHSPWSLYNFKNKSTTKSALEEPSFKMKN